MMRKRVTKFAPNGFYCLTGHASANSLFFESNEDQKLFLQLLERFLGEMIEVYGYSTNPTGWSLFFQVHDAGTIRNIYRKLKQISKKAKMKFTKMEPEDMLAEHFRYFLSAYVKQSNFRNGRHGSRVHSKMKKYVFESLEDLQEEIKKMKGMEETHVQKLKYRPNMNHYLVEKQLKRDSVWRHSFVGLNGEKLVQAVLPCFRWILGQTDVLRQLILDTWTIHFGPNNDQFPLPKLE